MKGKALLISKDNKVLLKRIDPNDEGLTEEYIQDIIYEYPELLPLAEIPSSYEPVHAIRKEFPVEKGSIDVFLISSQGNPIIVETKLWKNPEAQLISFLKIMNFGRLKTL